MTLRHLAILLALSAIVYFTGLGVPRLWDRDEPRNAQATREMLQRGDYVVPRFNGELRTHKPVLINWLMMTSYAAFDDPEFAARFWSAAMGVGTVLMTYVIGRRLFSPAVGLWGGIVLATGLLFTSMARLATPEMPFVFFLTAAKLVYVLGAFPPRADSAGEGEPGGVQGTPPNYFPTSWPVVALMYAMMGVAVLAKGPAGLVLPMAAVGMFLLIMRLPPSEADPAAPRTWGRRLSALARPFAPTHFLRTVWLMRPVTAVLVVAAVALPWYWLVWQKTDGAWVKGFIFEHNVGRAARPMEGHGGGLWVYPLTVLFFYPIAILVAFFPWSVLAVPVGVDLTRRVRQRHPWRPGIVFLACWAGVYIAAFSLARTKLASYMTPVCPALGLMAGVFLHHWSRRLADAPPKSVTDGLRLMAVVGAVMVVALPIVAWVFLRGEVWVGVIGLIPLVGGLAALRLIGRDRPDGATRAMAVTGALAALALVAVVVRVDRYQHSRPLLDAIYARSPSPRIATFSRHEPSWVFYSGQQLTDYRRPKDAADFLAGNPDAFVITSDDKLPALEPVLPDGVEVVKRTPYFGKTGDLLVIGRRDAERRVETAAP